MIRSAETKVRNLLEDAGVTLNGNNPEDPQVYDPTTYERIISGGSLAIGETYMDGVGL